MQHPRPRPRLSTRQVVLAGLLGALPVALKEVMSFLPNIEPVSLLFILYALEFPAIAPWAVAVFVALQFMLYGFGLWGWGYLYIWFLLILAVHCLRTMQGALPWALFSCVYGLCFGALFTPIYFVTQGPGGALAWWLAGIPADILHGVGNFTIMLLAYKPLRGLFHRLQKAHF